MIPFSFAVHRANSPPYFVPIGGKGETIMNEWASMYLPIGTTLIISIIAFFLKRSLFGRVDGCEAEIKTVMQNAVMKSDHTDDIKSCRNAIKEIRDSYTPLPVHNKDFDECRHDIKQIKEDYITREDFYREQSKTDKKLDRIMDILLEMSGGKRNGN